jgi:hypothetical protein
MTAADRKLTGQAPASRGAVPGGHGRTPAVPLLTCDARRRADVRQVLVGLVEHVLSRRSPGQAAPTLR